MLGHLIRTRRKQLRLTQEEVAAMGGPAAATQRKIEAGTFNTLRLGTTWPLERVYGWRPGAIEGFLNDPDRQTIENAIEPNYDALRVAGEIPAGTQAEDAVGRAGQDPRPALNIDENAYRDLSPEQLSELEHRLNAEAWRARREILGG